MGEHTKPGTGGFAPAVLDFLRAHKGAVRTVVTLLVGIAVTHIPDFPSDAVLSALALIIGG
ncbi:hypothetical protein ACIBKZ_15625 [Streptomyces sp. NPDC050421]|uniref:hypothetical protein n=1 Tax=Streptomyces sp. NPDC050421 TaxID=3365613 RepID=UPI00379B7CDD